MKFIDGYVRSPLAGLAPWVLMAIVNGPGRFEEAASAAFGLTLLTLWAGSRRGVRVHLLEAFTTAFFGVLALLGLVAPPETIEWLQLWAGALSNFALAAFAFVTLVIRRPFTLAIAKETTPEEFWDTPFFLRLNYVISGFWGGAFLVSGIAGAYGDLVLRDNDNFWTGWIVPIGAMVCAGAFTEFYPDYATATALVAAGEPTDPPQPLAVGLFGWLPPFLTVVGIVGLVSDELAAVMGIALIVAGIVGSGAVRKIAPN